MRCAWQSLINLLPIWMRNEADKRGKETCQELRIRLNQPPEMILKGETVRLFKAAEKEDLSYVINTASRYSPWTAATISNGYITAPGGHRIGICGQAIVKDGKPEGIREPSSVCIRVARDFPGIARNAVMSGSVLIIGSPGSGKTTFLRDLIRCRAGRGQDSISVVDERGEIFPYSAGKSCFSMERGIDVLNGTDKEQGINMVLRSMGPTCIAIDEITANTDAQALIRAAWCGVDLIATAHAASKEDLTHRPIYHEIVTMGIFQHLIVMRRDKSWHLERMDI